MQDALELRVDREGARVRLVSPEVGLYTSTHPDGALVAAGTVVGVLSQLGVRRALVVPAGVEGRIASRAPERRHHPLAYGDVVLEIEPLRTTANAAREGASVHADAGGTHSPAEGGLVLRATTSGRFWHRSAPGEPAFVTVGAVVRDGSPVGLLEVMKTFSHATYRAQGGLPANARVVAVLAGDGADVRRGDPLIAVESAP